MNTSAFVVRSIGWLGLTLLVTGMTYLLAGSSFSGQSVFREERQNNRCGGGVCVGPAPGLIVPTTRILLGVRTLQSSDRLFLLKLPEKIVEEQTVPEAWRSDDLSGRPTSTSIDVASGGVATLIFAKDSKVPLRTRSGETYQDASLFGLFDETHAAVYARRDERSILSVSRAGDIRELYELPEGAQPIGFDRDTVWIVSSQPGPGIESPPQGPSALIRVKSDGTVSTAATNTHVIFQAKEMGGSLAYGTDNGDLIVMRTQGAQPIINLGLPLLWIDEHHLLFAQGTALYLLDAMSGEHVSIGLLPGAPTVSKMMP